jgi:NAD(P)H dehydrogenase (quinone)
MIAITGANGKLGTAVIHHLLQHLPPQQIVAIVRDPVKVQHLSHTGIQVRKAGYDDKPSLQTALQGADQLLQISTTSIGQQGIEQEQNVVLAAKEQGVKHIIYTSSVAPQCNAFFLPTQQALETEQAIVASGIPYTFFRNSLYMETIPELIGNALQEGAIYYPAGNGKVSFVSRQDIAAALAKVICSAGHDNKIYEITGAAAYAFYDIAAMLPALKEAPVQYVDTPPDTYRDALTSFHLQEEIVNLLLSMAAGIRAGEFSLTTGTLELLLRRKPISLMDYLKSISSYAV